MEVGSSTTVHSITQSIERSRAESIEKPITSSSTTKVKEEKGNTVEELETVIQRMNEFMEPTNTFLRYKIHDKTQEYYVEIVNGEKDEVIREVPTKRVLDMYAAMTEYLGLMFDKKV